MLTIISDCGNFKAEVAEICNGCRAVFWQQVCGWRRLSHAVYDLPFHAALDEAHETVCKLRAFPIRH